MIACEFWLIIKNAFFAEYLQTTEKNFSYERLIRKIHKFTILHMGGKIRKDLNFIFFLYK